MALLPTKKISALTPITPPLTGFEELECVQLGNSRKLTSRDLVLPIDSLITVSAMGGSLPGSRQLVSSATVQVTDNGPGSTLQLDALFTGALPGNPTASVGLTPVNGVAVTWMRSDAAPPLDVSISPTWLGVHTYAQPITVSQGSPAYRLNESDAAADNRLWDQIAIGEQLLLRAVNDAGAVASAWATVDRTGTTIDIVNLLGTAVQANGSNILTVATAFANPTASVGLAAVNGAAITAMRSDAAPALSQAIAPTWSAQHIFSLSGATNAAILVSSAQPQTDYNESDAAANNRRWRWEAQGEQFLGRTVNDANSAAVTWIAVDRTLNVVDTIALTSTALTWNGSPLLSAATAFANPTGTVGLAAVNGAATTAMRSDAAPPLSQAIAPTWTAQHIFSLTGATNAAILLSSAQPQEDWNETDAAANNRRWRLEAQGEQFLARMVDDANSAAVTWLAVDRTLNVADTVAFTATAFQTTSLTSLITGTNAASAGVQLRIQNLNAASDNRLVNFRVNEAGDLRFGVMTDALVETTWLSVDRTGGTVDTVNFQTGVVTFSKNATDASPNITLTNTRPDLQFFENDAAANNGRWQLLATTQAFLFRAMSDDAATTNTIWRADRSGTTVVSVSFPTTSAASFQVGGTPVTAGTGTVLSYFTAPASSHVLALTSTTVTHNSLVAHNTATAGDNNFIAFGTEASFTGRGSITYNRAGGLVAYNTTSDARRKKNIRNSPDPGNLLDRIQVRAFEWVDSDIPLDYWFVAQELHAQFPVAVTRGDDEHDWAIDPSKLIPLMVKEMQSMRQRLIALETPGNRPN